MRSLLFFLLASFAGVLAAAPPGNKGGDELLSDAEEICTHESTKRGELDRRGHLYCMKVQRERILDIAQLNSVHADGYYTHIAYPHCYDEWTSRGTSNARMIAHCLNRELEGRKDVMFYADTLGDDVVAPIAKDALRRFKSWNTAAYRVKRELDPPP